MLGPFLFIVYINDLLEVVQSNISIFADDTKLYRSIITSDNSSTLLSDLDLLVKWCRVCHMKNLILLTSISWLEFSIQAVHSKC